MASKLTIKYNSKGTPLYYNKVGMQTNKETYLKQLAQEKKKEEREREKNKKLQSKAREKEQAKYKKELAAYEKENQRSAQEMALKAFERKEAAKETEEPKIDINVEALRNFRNAIDSESDSLSQKYIQILDKYSELIKVKETKVLAGKFLRLSNKYDRLNKNFNDLFLSIKKSRVVTKSNENTFDEYVKRVDIFEKEYEALVVEENSSLKVVQQKEKEKLQKEQDRQKKKESKDKRITKKRNESDIKKAALEKQKTDEARKKETRQRRIQAVEEGRAKQAQEEQNQKDQLLEQVEKKKQHLQSKREKSDKFFSSENSLVKGASKIGGGIGGFLGGVSNTLGLDFSDEKVLLSGLFSPIAALGKSGLGKVKSISEKRMDIDDASLESFDDVYQEGFKGKKKQLDIQKAQKALSNKNKVQKPSSSGFIKNKLKGIGSFLNSKNISNTFNKNSSQNSTSNSSNQTNSSQNTNVDPSSNDFNRTDDKEDKVNLGSTNGILIQILKELKKQTDGEKKSGGLLGGIGSKGSKALGLLKTFGVGGLALGGAAYLWSKFTNNEDSSTSNSSKNSNSNKILSTSNTSLYDSAKQDHEKFKNDHPTLAKVQKFLGGTVFDKESPSDTISNKFSKSNSLVNTNQNTSIKSTDSTFNKNESSKSVIKAEAKKIEKIRDDEKSNKDIADDMKKFFLEDFLNSAIDKFSSILINSKGSPGKSPMKPIQPF